MRAAVRRVACIAKHFADRLADHFADRLLPVRAGARPEALSPPPGIQPPSPAMRCLLHIGTEKTGTTLLQDWLYANREALSAQGVCLSSLLDVPNNRKLAAYFQGTLDDYHQAHRILEDDARHAFFAGFEEAVAEEIATLGQTHHTMVITSEHFHSRVRAPGAIAALRDFLLRSFDEVKVVCYFREQSEMLRSLYSTAMRVSHVTTLAEFQREFMRPGEYYCDFEQIAGRWSEAFGRAHCDFRIYDRRAFAQGDLRRDFAACFFQPIDADALDYAQDSANESLSAVEAALFRLVNLKVPYWLDEGGGVNMRNLALKQRIAACEALKVGRLVDAAADEVRARFEDSNRRFFARYFEGRSEGFPASPVTADAHDAPQFSLNEVRTMLLALLGTMLDEPGQGH